MSNVAHIKPLPRRITRLALWAAAAALAGGCASTGTGPANPDDPWESYNRGMFKFNDTVDKALYKPVTQAYVALTPEPARNCLHNAFNNVGDVWSAINSFLQGRIPDGINTIGRVLFNTTMGLGGCIDVASMNGSRRIPNDLGVTLGVWGIKPGPYFVLPLLGPSTVRDSVATGTSLATGLSPYMWVMEVDNVPVRNGIIALALLDLRASLLDTDEMVDRIALDRYSFIRDAYLQRRAALVRGRNADGTLPDYSDGDLPDYSDEDLPDYSDDDQQETK